MQVRIIVTLALLFTIGAVLGNAQTATCEFTFFKVLQGATPSIGGINDFDYTSGTVQNSQGNFEGWKRAPNGTITTFLINGQFNQASKINNAGAIVGSYYPSGTSAQAGYRRAANGSVTKLSDPNGANGTAAYGINNAGEIVGYYDTSSAVQYGFAYMNGAFKSFSHPRWRFLQPEGVNKYGAIVGTYLDSSSIMHGFLFTNGLFATLNFPGASNTAAMGINDSGEIVGWYVPKGAIYSQGFIYLNGKYSTLLVNGKPSVDVNAVNNYGHIYGDAYGKSFIGKNCH